MALRRMGVGLGLMASSLPAASGPAGLVRANDVELLSSAFVAQVAGCEEGQTTGEELMQLRF
jgi:hypothetical protein